MRTTCTQLIYFSLWRPEAGQDLQHAMRDVLAVSSHNNSQLDVTGALVCCNGWFLQLLEGSESAVGEIYARILGDRRHHSVTQIDSQIAMERAFPLWSMCGAQLSLADDATLKILGRHRAFSPPLLSFADALQILRAVQQIQTRTAA